MHRPGRVANLLAISPASLRGWSVEFAQYLSPEAQKSPTEAGTRNQRRYTDADLETLKRIKALLAQGMTYAEIHSELSPPGELVGDQSAPASAPTDPPTQQQGLAVSEQTRLALASMQQTIEAQARHIDDLLAQRDKAQSEAQELRRALLDQAKRPEPEQTPRRWWEFWK